MTLSIAMPVPADAGLNPDNKDLYISDHFQ
jgi:hypothetical protein